MIEVHHGDITQLRVDAIVSAVNQHLLGDGGVDGAIQRAAGPGLVEACRLIGVCPVGEVRATPGFNLPVKRVYHTAGPVWRGGSLGEPELLAACYRKCLALARRDNIRSIAFPAISCGIYDYPPELAVEIAVEQVQSELERDCAPQQVIFCCSEQEMAELYRLRLDAHIRR